MQQKINIINLNHTGRSKISSNKETPATISPVKKIKIEVLMSILGLANRILSISNRSNKNSFLFKIVQSVMNITREKIKENPPDIGISSLCFFFFPSGLSSIFNFLKKTLIKK